MNRRTLIVAPAAIALAACAGRTTLPLSAEERASLRIGDVQIVSSAAVFDGAGAEERRNRLSPDLTAELRDEFADRIAAGGWTLQAEIGRLAVVGATATSFGRDRSELQGSLRLIDPTGALRASVPITVTAGASRETLGGSIVGAATTAVTGGGRGRFYRSLLNDFARQGRELLLGRDLPGQRLTRRITTAPV